MEKLPTEMLLETFQLLSYEDLKTVMEEDWGDAETVVLALCSCHYKKHVFNAEDTEQQQIPKRGEIENPKSFVKKSLGVNTKTSTTEGF